MFRVSDTLKRDSRSTVLLHLGPDVYVANLAIVALSYLALEAFKHRDGDRNIFLASDFPANDFQFACNITNIANSGLCVLHLARDGFDTQARILLRSLSEAIYQTLIVFSTASEFTEYHAAQDAAQTKETWYRLFGGKKRLYSKLSALEARLGMHRGRLEQLAAWREEQMVFFSQDTHHASPSAHIGSLAYAFDGDRVEPAILGGASRHSRLTIQHLGLQLFSFVGTMHDVLLKIHRWSPDIESANVCRYLAAFDAICEVSHELLEPKT
jgi:hypothetical protein